MSALLSLSDENYELVKSLIEVKNSLVKELNYLIMINRDQQVLEAKKRQISRLESVINSHFSFCDHLDKEDLNRAEFSKKIGLLLLNYGINYDVFKFFINHSYEFLQRIIMDSEKKDLLNPIKVYEIKPGEIKTTDKPVFKLSDLKVMALNKKLI